MYALSFHGSEVPRTRVSQTQMHSLSPSLASPVEVPVVCGAPPRSGLKTYSEVGLFQKLPSTDFVLLGLLVECALKTSKAESRH